MVPHLIVKIGVLVLTAFGIVLITTPSPHQGQTSGKQICVDRNVKKLESELKNLAQKALDAIDSKCKLSASQNRANRGQHVFNNGLLKIHHKVLEKLVKDVGGYDYNELLNNLVQITKDPLKPQQNAIGTMVARFSSEEFYVDFNADVFGEYVDKLRKALVEYLKAQLEEDIYRIQMTRENVQDIAGKMVKYEVYVDRMARDRWLHDNKKKEKQYNDVKAAVEEMVQNISQDFEEVPNKIREFWKQNKSDFK